jgi:hypothetical protein
MAAHNGVPIDRTLQKSVASQKVFCILWANKASDGHMVKVNLVALDELYNLSITFLFWTLTPCAQKGNLRHQPFPDS